MYVDSHAHLTSDTLNPHIDKLIDNAKQANLHTIINICTDLETLKRGLLLNEKYPWIYNAGSTTPHDVEKEGELYFQAFEEAALEKKLIAVGETGLDYYYEHSPKELQKEFFIRYLKLARKASLPIIIHCREAFKDFFDLIDEHYPSNRGVLHCFTGTLDEAQELIKRDWMISFSGIVTFKKSLELQEVAKIVPEHRFLIETDSPYLAPQSKRGKTNEPSYVVEVAQKIAELKKMKLSEVAQKSTENAFNLFSLKEN